MPAKAKLPKPVVRKRFTQAVVIFHGIGEQRPMQTLRSFAEAILPVPKQGGEKFFSKPDALSESFELRKLQNRSQPRTHLFEYYWAYQVDGTRLGDIWSWLVTLLIRRPRNVPKQLLPLWLISWILVVLTILGFCTGILNQFVSALWMSPSMLVSTMSGLFLAAIQWAVIYYIGDAARYLSPTPRNIRLRHDIRADGIRLLRRIQSEGKYDRVIFVGHSLGSVIAYDILRQVWEGYQEAYQSPKTSAQPALARAEKIGEALRAGTGEYSLNDYTDAQVELWKELRDLGLPWLVTDLITMGSPLAHAAMLLATDQADLRARQRQRELPTNPPEPELEKSGKIERGVYSYRVWDKYGKKQDIVLRALHDAALFACTRWTNLYIPASFGLFGDIVGGPLGKMFGPGIRDIAVRSRNWLRDRTLLAHNSYWAKDSVAERSAASQMPYALNAIIDALDLNGKSYYMPANEPAQNN